VVLYYIYCSMDAPVQTNTQNQTTQNVAAQTFSEFIQKNWYEISESINKDDSVKIAQKFIYYSAAYWAKVYDVDYSIILYDAYKIIDWDIINEGPFTGPNDRYKYQYLKIRYVSKEWCASLKIIKLTEQISNIRIFLK